MHEPDPETIERYIHAEQTHEQPYGAYAVIAAAFIALGVAMLYYAPQWGFAPGIGWLPLLGGGYAFIRCMRHLQNNEGQ